MSQCLTPQRPTGARGQAVPAVAISMRLAPSLYASTFQEADRRGVPIVSVLEDALADHLERSGHARKDEWFGRRRNRRTPLGSISREITILP